MDYILSVNNGFGLANNTPELSIKVMTKTKELLHDIDCGNYISSLLYYQMYTYPILSSNSVVYPNKPIQDAVVIRYTLKSDVNIDSYLEQNQTQLSAIVTMLSNILRFLSSNDITHTNIHYTNVIMNIHNTYPLLGDFSYSIIRKKYKNADYVPTHYWKCPSYHLFCFLLMYEPTEILRYDIIVEIINDIVNTSFGVLFPIQYVTNISNTLHQYIGQSYQHIINVLITNSYKWDIYSMHVLLYECTPIHNELYNDCKKYIIDQKCSIFK
jgi:hypothetical protein